MHVPSLGLTISCRHRSGSLFPGHAQEASCSARNWQHWPSAVPPAFNDNAVPRWARARALVAAALGSFLALAVAVGVLEP